MTALRAVRLLQADALGAFACPEGRPRGAVSILRTRPLSCWLAGTKNAAFDATHFLPLVRFDSAKVKRNFLSCKFFARKIAKNDRK